MKMTPEKIGPFIEHVSHLSFDLKETLKTNYNWNCNDARYTIYNKIINVLNTANFGYVFLCKYLSNKEWWLENEKLGVEVETMRNTCQEFEMSIRISLIQNITYAIESSFRTFSRSIQPGACNNGMAEFKSIYASLFKKTSLQKHEELFDLFRNIRNTMHNNGLFYPLNGKNQTIKFQNREFIFEVGKHCNFVDTELIVQLSANLIVAIKDLVESKEFTDLKLIPEES